MKSTWGLTQFIREPKKQAEKINIGIYSSLAEAQEALVCAAEKYIAAPGLIARFVPLETDSRQDVFYVSSYNDTEAILERVKVGNYQHFYAGGDVHSYWLDIVQLDIVKTIKVPVFEDYIDLANTVEDVLQEHYSTKREHSSYICDHWEEIIIGNGDFPRVCISERNMAIYPNCGNLEVVFPADISGKTYNEVVDMILQYCGNPEPIR